MTKATVNEYGNPVGAIVGTIIMAAAIVACAWQALTPKAIHQSPPYVEQQLNCGPNGTAKSYKGAAVCAYN